MRVLTTGVFDVLHVGHLLFLQEARNLGDELIVLVSCDKVCEEEKHVPVNSQNDRRRLVEALKPVSQAFIGPTKDKLGIVLKINPDMLVLGYDQRFDIPKLKRELRARGYAGGIVRLPRYAKQSTTSILKKIRNRKLFCWGE